MLATKVRFLSGLNLNKIVLQLTYYVFKACLSFMMEYDIC